MSAYEILLALSIALGCSLFYLRSGLKLRLFLWITGGLLIVGFAGAFLYFSLFYSHTWPGKGASILGALIAGYIYLSVIFKRAVPSSEQAWWAALRAFAPAFALGKIACIAAQCCEGRICPPYSWHAWLYERIYGLERPLRYPIQTYEFIGLLLIWGLLERANKMKQSSRSARIQYIFSYILLRIAAEYFRA